MPGIERERLRAADHDDVEPADRTLVTLVAAESICREQQHRITDRRAGDDERRAQRRLDVVAEHQAHQACGDRAEQHRPGEPALADLAALRDRQHPIARHRRERGAEVDDDGHQGAEVDRHIELEPLVGPVREIGHENQVARARNRQELSDSLDDGKDDDVQRIHETRPGKRSTARMLAANLGAATRRPPLFGSPGRELSRSRRGQYAAW